ncbi:unnamed protein product, partial [marine sediment metagenome]
SRSFEERVNDLVSRMTLEEKISQMINTAVGIPRLHIPKYNWWNECLHGVWSGDHATVFPQAIGLAATWNEDLMFKVATVISDEARAKHHEFVRRGKRGLFQGLTFWSPNVNLFRDPRWGRGQETYGEDPYLSSRMGVNFVKGLQGDDPKYLKVVATPKHYVVHSGPEGLRHGFNAIATSKNLYETYLPAFEACIREGNAYSIMCAYNRTNEDPCCSSEQLKANPVMINMPTLVIWGEKDTALTVHNLKGLDEFIPDLTIKRIPEGSHWVVNEQPDKVNTLIREFI